jgi:HPt (histidine-containing phosphotransfer) domain-containing protein
MVVLTSIPPARRSERAASASHPASDASANAEIAVLDLAHLKRMAMGEDSLEREVLVIFDRQAGMLLDCLQHAKAQSIAAHAHTLAGSARAIGAWRMVAAAQALERAVTETDVSQAELLLRALIDTIAETRAAIAERLQD